jgi:hypothetical protein
MRFGRQPVFVHLCVKCKEQIDEKDIKIKECKYYHKECLDKVEIEELKHKKYLILK